MTKPSIHIDAPKRKRSQMIEETRAKLIDAARRAFAEKGYMGASMDDFTAQVGLTRGALYHHFGDKKGLFIAVIRQIDDEINDRILAKTKRSKTLWDALLEETKTYFECMLEPDISQIWMRDGVAVLGDISFWPDQDKYDVLLSQTLTKLMDEKVIYSCDSYALARQINGAMHGTALWIANADHPQETFEKSWYSIQLLLNGLKMVPAN